LADHYDLHGWDWYAPTFGERLMTLLRERGLGSGASILDAGCGTGSLAIMLARAGFRVTGLDFSPEMIRRARVKDAAGAVEWRVGDITALDLGATFDAVVSVADVFNHFEDLADWESALRGLHRHLRPDGLACIDAMTCRGLEQMDVQSVQERGGVTLILSIIYERAARRSTLKVTSFAPIASDPPTYDRAQQTITEWGQLVGDVLPLFARAGFSTVDRVWATSDEPENDDRLTLLARR